MYIEGDVPYCGNNNSGFGNGWEGLIGLALVAGLFDNGNGGGIFGNRGGNNGGCCTAGLATQADLANGFAQNTLQRGIDDIILGQAQMQNFINQGFAGLNSTLNSGFAGVDNAVCTLGYQQAQLVNGLSRELADCCCAQARNIDSLRYDMSKGFCDVIRAGQDNTNAVIGWLTQEKISSLQAENAGLKAQISNDRQSAYIVSQLKEPCPVPAYLTCDPRVPYNYNQCGCGCN